MAGDGVSLPTTLVQLGNLAGAPSRSQQTGAAGGAQATPLPKEEAQPLQKVREGEKTDKERIGREDDRPERRGRRSRRRKVDAAPEAPADAADAPETRDEASSNLGSLVDTKA